jgi:hypothetical protein
MSRAGQSPAYTRVGTPFMQLCAQSLAPANAQRTGYGELESGSKSRNGAVYAAFESIKLMHPLFFLNLSNAPH